MNHYMTVALIVALCWVALSIGVLRWVYIVSPRNPRNCQHPQTTLLYWDEGKDVCLTCGKEIVR